MRLYVFACVRASESVCVYVSACLECVFGPVHGVWVWVCVCVSVFVCV